MGSQMGATGLYQRSNERGWRLAAGGWRRKTLGRLTSVKEASRGFFGFYPPASRQPPVASPQPPAARPRQSSAYAPRRDATYTSR